MVRNLTSAFCTCAASSFVTSCAGFRATSPAVAMKFCCLSWMLCAVAAVPPLMGPKPVRSVSAYASVEALVWVIGSPSAACSRISFLLGRR